MLKPVSDRPGVHYVEVRDTLYFGTYSYRASMMIESPRWVTSSSSDESKGFARWQLTNPMTKGEYRVRIEGSRVSVFSDDLSFLQTLNSFYTAGVEITQAIANSKVDEVKYCAREPKYRYRMYVKTFLPMGEAIEMKQLVEEQQDNINCPYPLHRALREIGFHHNSFYNTYINTNDEATVTFILMRYDHLFKKVVRMEKMPEITGMINTL